jgi:RNA polymerase sigma factor (sigma-70 family)
MAATGNKSVNQSSAFAPAAAVTTLDLESSVELLQRAKGGDPDAANRLANLYLSPLTRWARGKLPQWARDMSDTQDLVQDAVLNTLKHLQEFEPARDGALHAYLRMAVMNRVRDEIRRVRRRPYRAELDDEIPATGPSPFTTARENEAYARYQAALGQLHEDEREALIARLELGLTYHEIAMTLGRPSPDAARVAIRRALLKVTQIMKGAS